MERIEHAIENDFEDTFPIRTSLKGIEGGSIYKQTRMKVQWM